MELKAYAKINLGLRILHKRIDGYHDIESIFLYINWYDILEIEKSNEFNFSCSDPVLPVDETNLVVRAVREIEKETGNPFLFHINLIKNIPYGAGLGGGSSDASCIINFAKTVYSLSDESCHTIASSLGSDLNFFLDKGTQIASDRGIILTPVDFRINAFILTVFPNVSVSTKWAYQQIRAFNGYSKSYKELLNEKPVLIEYQKTFINDFDFPVSNQFNEIQNVKNILKDLGSVYTSLSGSGSAVFGLFEKKEEAEKAGEILGRDFAVNLTSPNFIL